MMDIIVLGKGDDDDNYGNGRTRLGEEILVYIVFRLSILFCGIPKYVL
jgi:hypothetical protein